MCFNKNKSCLFLVKISTKSKFQPKCTLCVMPCLSFTPHPISCDTQTVNHLTGVLNVVLVSHVDALQTTTTETAWSGADAEKIKSASAITMCEVKIHTVSGSWLCKTSLAAWQIFWFEAN